VCLNGHCGFNVSVRLQHWCHQRTATCDWNILQRDIPATVCGRRVFKSLNGLQVVAEVYIQYIHMISLIIQYFAVQLLIFACFMGTFQHWFNYFSLKILSFMTETTLRQAIPSRSFGMSSLAASSSSSVASWFEIFNLCGSDFFIIIVKHVFINYDNRDSVIYSCVLCLFSIKVNILAPSIVYFSTAVPYLSLRSFIPLCFPATAMHV